ncbi:MAG: UPF0182 family protein [Pseudonocardiales bacterium]|nr:UPF0182 family protein [Pseudonocardiales bacterium]
MANRPPVGVPALSRRARILITVGAVALVTLIIGSRLIDTYVDWLWFGEVGFRSVFSTVLVTRLVQFVVAGLVVGGLLALNIVLAFRTRPVFVPVAGPEDPVARYRSAIVGRLRLFGLGVPALVGLIAGLSALGDWQTVQMFLHGTSFGVSDPQFHKDVSFYAFELPFYRMLLGWAFVAVVVSFVGALLTHYLFGGLRLAGRGGGQLSGPARVQLGVLAGTFVLLKAFAYFLDRYELMFSRRNPLFTGASYTDLNAVLPAKIILMCIAVICAVAFFVGAVLRNLQLPAIAIALLLLSSILVGAAWPVVLEQFVVRPNANEREAPSIQRNIAATRQAYGITDRQVQYIPYSGRSVVSPADVRADTATIPNVRLLDPSVLSPTFTQLQQRENFYGFPDKLDVDRYTINGKTQDYIVAVRELESASLAENQRTWINQHLTFTHGNGFVAAPANTVNSALKDAGSGEGGYPVFTVSDTTQQGDIPVQQPRIYFGELIDDYAIVGGNPGARPREFDGRPENYTYQGKGGVPLGSWMRRLIFASYYGERNILFNQAIGPDSKIIYNQHPRERVEKVAPWLTVDGDPYPAVINGRIEWILDGYTTLDNYPYAQRTVLGKATTDSLTGPSRPPLPDEEISYIRNSVKATVDAYDGTVTLYAVDENDPVLRTWMNVFPGTVRPASAISNELREHFRYPEDLFKVQREMLARYHVNNPSVFFTNDDFWNVPTDPTQNQQGVDQPPYYVLAGPPNGRGPAEFQLTSALVSLRRPFLASYISVGCDPEDYGKIRVLELPGESQTLGPEQVQNRFVSSADVSRELNLLRQSETDVRYGNLLTLPVGGGLLYVEPVYIERANRQAAFPQLNRVLVAYGDRIGYAPTLREALNQVFGAGAGDATVSPDQQAKVPNQGATQSPAAAGPGVANQEIRQSVTDIADALKRLRAAQVSGDFAAQGKALADLDAATKRFDTATAAAGGAATPAPGGGGG